MTDGQWQPDVTLVRERERDRGVFAATLPPPTEDRLHVIVFRREFHTEDRQSFSPGTRQLAYDGEFIPAEYPEHPGSHDPVTRHARGNVHLPGE